MNIPKKSAVLALSLLIIPANAFIDRRFFGGLATGTALMGAAWLYFNDSTPETCIPEHQPEAGSIEVEGHLSFTEPYKMEISVNEGALGDDFNFEDFDNGIDVVIRKRRLRILTTYDLYKNDGSFDAKMSHKITDYINPLAFFASSQQSFKVRGADGSHLGSISGVLITFEKAMYEVYDRHGRLAAVARVKKNGLEVQINDPKASKTAGIATLKKALNDNWVLHVSKPGKIDHRLLKFLGVVIVDKLAPELEKRAKDAKKRAAKKAEVETPAESPKDDSSSTERSGYGDTERR